VSGSEASKSHGVGLFCTDTRCFGENGRRLLTGGDRERLSSLATPRRRLEYETGRALTRFALQSWTGRPAHSHELRSAPGGKPECRDGPAISVSHSGELVVCAVTSSGDIGTDVQFPVPGRHTAAIAKRYFSAEENAWLDEDPSSRFYMLWVLKEAYLKAVGLGLTGGLDLLACRIEPPKIVARVARGGVAAHLALYAAGRAFVALAKVDNGFSQVRVEFWNPDGSAEFPSSALTLIAATDGVDRLR
jgi:phosphopantetheinyl transferase